MSTQFVPRFSHLGIEGFRRLKQADIELRPLTVLIGANGSGKTSLLDAWTLLARSARGELSQCISEFQGVAAMRSGGEAEKLRFSTSMPVTGNQPLRYTLELAAEGTGFRIDNESLLQIRDRPDQPFMHLTSDGNSPKFYDVKSKKLAKPDWQLMTGQTMLSQVPPMFKEPEQFRKTLAASTFYHALDVSPRAPVRVPQPMRPATLPGENGEELISCLYTMRETDQPRFQAVEDALSAGFPDFQRLEFPPVAAGTLALAWRDKNFRHPLYMHQLSEGTLRYLWLVTLLNSPGLTEVTLIDEPEVSLHPELLNLLVHQFRAATSRTQLIVATHADRLVRSLKPGEVLAMDITQEGWAESHWGDSFELDKWMDEFSLDQLWGMGELGGRSH